MKKELEKCRNEQNIVLVFANQNDTESFLCGWIAEYSDKYVLIDRVTPKGRYDGYVVVKTEDIYRIEKNSMYEEKITLLSNMNNIKRKYKKIPKTSSDLLNDLSNFSQQNQHLVSVELCDSDKDDTQGMIKSVSEDTVEVVCIDSCGRIDGESIIAREQISSFSCDDDYCATLLKLHKQRAALETR